MATNITKNECKLMILYLLSKICFPINHENLSGFFIDKYTSYISFQQMLAELVETKLVEENRTKTTICYESTKDGLDALISFSDDISTIHKAEIDDYIKKNKIKIKEESIITADFLDSANDNFKVTLEIKENKSEEFKIELDVPNADAATTICENWKAKAKTIYTYIIKQLL